MSSGRQSSQKARAHETTQLISPCSEADRRARMGACTVFRIRLGAHLHQFFPAPPCGGHQHHSTSPLVNCMHFDLYPRFTLLTFTFQRCALCGQAEGAVIRCSDCVKEFHASCAWTHGCKFGFEIQPVRVHSSREPTGMADLCII
jgi:hypothetical protein